MAKDYRKSLFIFRRDLRLQDNTGLIAALKSSEKVMPCFIFDPRQVDKNSYRSLNAIQFMLESLQELDQDLQKKGGCLYYFQGEAGDVVEGLLESEGLDAVFVNHDYTPFSRKRDSQLADICDENSVDFNSHFDLLLTEVGSALTGKGTPYTVYSHFLKKAVNIPIAAPAKNNYKNYYSKPVSGEVRNVCEEVLPEGEYNEDLYVHGGRKAALKILRSIDDYANYDEERNFPGLDATTGLSSHNKFGTVSVREVYYAIKSSLGATHTLIRELYWRDFFTHVAFNFPRVFGHSFQAKFEKIEWKNDRKAFNAWCAGKTGYPIVDAGMRELNATGFMHNRVRMIVASFLVKDLHISWRWGEKYFAKLLVDYDPAVNNGNWQWAASTGCDAQPYFRIFNPWIQGKKFDPDCVYIKKWVPELKAYDPKLIHKLEKGESLLGYTPAIVKHSEAKEIAEDLFVSAADRAANS